MKLVTILKFPLLTLTAFIYAGCGGGDESAGNSTDGVPDLDKAAQIVRDGVMKFENGIASDDESVRIATVDEFIANEQHLNKLFGEDGGKALWEKIGPQLQQIREHTDMFQKQVLQNGRIVDVEVINVREDNSSDRYEAVLGVIPDDIPVFRVVKEYDGTTAGSSSYVVMDGKMVFVRGLEGMQEYLQQQKASSEE